MDRTLLIRAACAIRDTMIANQDYLTSLDQQNGDGDLGVSMVQGYSAVARYLESVEEEDLGRLFMKAASVFNEAAPSTLGTITSFFLMGMARALKGKREASLEDMAVACEVGLALLMEKAGSKPGEKTIVDSLEPAVRALRTHLGEGAGKALAEAAHAAAEGSEATRAMKPVHGRAAYYGDKCIGLLDGGSVAGRLVFESLANLAASAQ